MHKAIWFSYDLGVRGDYESLYQWLDQHEAIECGDSIAFLRYEYTETNDVLFIDKLKSDITESVKLTKYDRIYVIWKDGPKIRGKFVFGNRKAAPWAGFAGNPSDFDEE
jgi:hypothetical protein